MMPPPYNDLMEIAQTRDYVIVTRELAAPRLIPIDGRPHLPEPLRRWGGDSRGRWDGDTLVVDTTNFNPKTAMLGSTGTLHVVVGPAAVESTVAEALPEAIEEYGPYLLYLFNTLLTYDHLAQNDVQKGYYSSTAFEHLPN